MLSKFVILRSQISKSKSNSIVPQHQLQKEHTEAATERLKRLNDLVAKESRTSIDQTSSDEDNEKVKKNILILFSLIDNKLN